MMNRSKAAVSGDHLPAHSPSACGAPKARSRLLPCIATGLSVLLALVTIAPLGAQTPPAPRDDMRMPWQRTEDGFIRQWLVLGEFPFDGKHADFLTGQGGETAIVPAAGLAHKRPDGSEISWREYTSNSTRVDFAQVFAGRPTNNVVAYAFATVEWPADESAALLLGSSDGVVVWLNGKEVHRISGRRGVTADQDQVEVPMRAGTNRLLLKVDNASGSWGFIARVMKWNPPERVPRLSALIEESAGNNLSLSTNAASGTAKQMQVDVLAAGGVVRASQTATRGERLTFDTSQWQHGAYDIRVTGQDWQGNRERVFVSWYKGDMLAALKHLVETAPKNRGGTPDQMQHAMLAEMVLDRMGGKLDSLQDSTPSGLIAKSAPAAMTLVNDIPLNGLHNILMEFEELQQQAGGGIGGAHASGFVRLAYLDETDGSPQFCRVYLPGDYDPSRKWPMIVHLHEFNQENPIYVRWWLADVRHPGSLPERHNVILIEPHGRNNTFYRGIGERDVLRSIEMAKRRFSVDEDRVYLTGESMGGGGTWSFASQHPELFAAIAPIFGTFDYHGTMPPERRAALSSRERYQLEQASSIAQAESLLGLPIWVHHGDADTVVSVEQSRYAVRMLQRWRYNIRYSEHPGLGHKITGIEDDLAQWMLQHRRNADPRRVRVRAAALQSASAYWVTIEQREKQDAFMVAQADIAGPNTIRLDTENVLAVSLSPGSALVDPAKPLRVVWNGTPHTVTVKDGRARLAAPGYTTAGLHKNAAVEGPIRSLMNTPFAVVVGTVSADPAMRELCQSKAQSVVDAWQNAQHQPLRLFKDTEITEQEIAKYSLLLIGGDDANAVTKKLAASLPLSIAGKTVTIAGRTFEAPDAVATMVYPHPMNSERYVVIAAATSSKGMRFLNLTHTTLGSYDFHIVKGEPSSPPASLQNILVAAGMFDREWKIDPALLETP